VERRRQRQMCIRDRHHYQRTYGAIDWSQHYDCIAMVYAF
jgi:hypothetical protein